MKIVFMGTPDFSAVVLEKLHSVYPVSCVVTGLDKPVGRGYQLKPSPLKQTALELGIPVLQYEKVSREGIEDIANLQPDLVITAAFGQILSEKFLSIPKYGVLNVHASLLPKYRGSSPIQWSIINGDKETGITIMKTVKAVDAGDILLKKVTPIGDSETAGELFDRLAILGGEAIIEAVKLVDEGNAVFHEQNHQEATHCSMISKEDGCMDFSKTIRQIDCFVRGMSPWPSAFTHVGEKMLKVFGITKADFAGDISTYLDGEVISSDSKDGLLVKVQDGVIRLCDIQLEGSKRMKDVDFLRGRNIEVGTILK